MTEHLKLPIGIDSFEKIRKENFYYVDKTKLIEQLLQNWSKVNLFTRPRRFGKTLNMSMIKNFFEIGTDKRLFDGLYISSKKELCEEYMGKYPVIFLSLKGVEGLTFEEARDSLCELITSEVRRFKLLLNSALLDNDEKNLYHELVSLQDSLKSELGTKLKFSLKKLSELLYQHYGKKVIILIDEYDVPLENAYFRGFYDHMIDFIRSLLESALKTNPYLEKCVITGCLRISKESIFTGLNNLKVDSVLHADYGDAFGFTEKEVEEMLSYYGLDANLDEVKQWYDGYLFHGIEIYNPWSIVNYVYDRSRNITMFPLPYWSNTSSNSIIRELVYEADDDVKREIESLLDSGTIEKRVHEEITYADIHQSQDNLWNFLFFTGYLKKINEYYTEEDDICLEMAIPNLEVKKIYRDSIIYWFDKRMKETDRSPLIHALETGDCAAAEDFINRQLAGTISYYDYAENFYHGFMAGLLVNASDYSVKSNRESGNGRPDIVLTELKFMGRAMILELKVSDTVRGMEMKCQEALAQIEEQHYVVSLQDEGYSEIMKYAVCFFKKGCLVRKG